MSEQTAKKILAFLKYPNYISVSFEESTDHEIIKEIVERYLAEPEITKLSAEQYIINNVSDLYTAQKIYEDIVQYYAVDSFIYNTNVYVGEHIVINEYNTLNDYNNESEEILKEYCESFMPELTVEEYSIREYGEIGVRIVSKNNETIGVEEQIDIANKIYAKYGISPNFTILESPSQRIESIDMANSVKGDANLDGRTTVADSVAILQSIGNRDKYQLSAQGIFNADIVGDYDGITAADALAIQRLDTQNEF